MLQKSITLILSNPNCSVLITNYIATNMTSASQPPEMSDIWHHCIN